MPQRSYAYAVARIRALEGKLLDKQKFYRILETGSADEALKALLENGYGAAETVSNPGDYELLIKREMNDTYELINKITPDKGMTDLFLLKYDYHNAKVLKKNSLLDIDSNDLLIDGGSISIETLHEAIYEKIYAYIPKPLGNALYKLDNIIATSGAANPQLIDVLIDRAMFEQIAEEKKKYKNEFINEYFTTKADLTNIEIFIRAKAIGVSKAEMEEMLIDGGEIDNRTFLQLYEQPLENAVQTLSIKNYGEVVINGIASFINTKSIAAYEKLTEELLQKIVDKYKYNAFTIEPIVGYMLAKEQESKAIRIVMTAKINAIDPAVVQERLSGLYA